MRNTDSPEFRGNFFSPKIFPRDSDYEALQRELEKIRKEKEEVAKKKEEEEAAVLEEKRKEVVGDANPLMNTNQSLKRRWDDDTVFKNQAQKEPKVSGCWGDWDPCWIGGWALGSEKGGVEQRFVVPWTVWN